MGLHGAAAMDVGVCRFVAIYDANGPVISWGGGDMDDRIFRDMHAADRLRNELRRWRRPFRQRRNGAAATVPCCANFSVCETSSTTCTTISSRVHIQDMWCVWIYIHTKLGGRKVFACPDCGYPADRDASATRNIMLRYLTIHNIHV